MRLIIVLQSDSIEQFITYLNIHERKNNIYNISSSTIFQIHRWKAFKIFKYVFTKANNKDRIRLVHEFSVALRNVRPGKQDEYSNYYNWVVYWIIKYNQSINILDLIPIMIFKNSTIKHCHALIQLHSGERVKDTDLKNLLYHKPKYYYILFGRKSPSHTAKAKLIIDLLDYGKIISQYCIEKYNFSSPIALYAIKHYDISITQAPNSMELFTILLQRGVDPNSEPMLQWINNFICSGRYIEHQYLQNFIDFGFDIEHFRKHIMGNTHHHVLLYTTRVALSYPELLPRTQAEYELTVINNYNSYTILSLFNANYIYDNNSLICANIRNKLQNNGIIILSNNVKAFILDQLRKQTNRYSKLDTIDRRIYKYDIDRIVKDYSIIIAELRKRLIDNNSDNIIEMILNEYDLAVKLSNS